MRRLALLLIACPLIALAFGPQVREMMLAIASRDAFDLGPVTDGLVAYWSMREDDGTVFDEHGSNDGTVEGGVTFGTAYGVRNDGADFDGTNGFISVGGLAKPPHITLSAWIHADDVTAFRAIIDGDASSGAGRSWQFRLDSDTGYLRFILFVGGSDHQVVDNQNLSGAWHHVAATYDGTEAIIYVNGQARNDSSNMNGDMDGGTGAQFGARRKTTYIFDGSIDEARIYNRALAPAEITELYEWDKAGAGH